MAKFESNRYRKHQVLQNCWVGRKTNSRRKKNTTKFAVISLKLDLRLVEIGWNLEMSVMIAVTMRLKILSAHQNLVNNLQISYNVICIRMWIMRKISKEKKVAKRVCIEHYAWPLDSCFKYCVEETANGITSFSELRFGQYLCRGSVHGRTESSDMLTIRNSNQFMPGMRRRVNTFTQMKERTIQHKDSHMKR